MLATQMKSTCFSHHTTPSNLGHVSFVQVSPIKRSYPIPQTISRALLCTPSACSNSHRRG